MNRPPSQEGKISFAIPSISTPCFTFYKIFGSLSSQTPPVIVLHGGPGGGHDCILAFADLWVQYGVPVILYDQIGCGHSTHLDSHAGDQAFWTEELFIAELENLIEHFKLRDGLGYHLRDRATFASQRPQGLRKFILASAFASMDLNAHGMRLLRDQLPADMQPILQEAEETGNFDSPAYKEVVALCSKRHVCRADPLPPELMASFKNLSSPSARGVYTTMYAQSYLFPGRGVSLQGWTCIRGLANITAPTLVYNGKDDTSHDIATAPFFEKIPRVRWVKFPEAGHFCHVEPGLREKVAKVVGEFLVADITTES